MNTKFRLAFIEAERRRVNQEMENYAKSHALIYKARQKRVAENPEYYPMVEEAIAMCKKERELQVAVKRKIFNFKLFWNLKELTKLNKLF